MYANYLLPSSSQNTFTLLDHSRLAKLSLKAALKMLSLNMWLWGSHFCPFLFWILYCKMKQQNTGAMKKDTTKKHATKRYSMRRRYNKERCNGKHSTSKEKSKKDATYRSLMHTLQSIPMSPRPHFWSAQKKAKGRVILLEWMNFR